MNTATQAQKIINISNQENAMLTDFDLAAQIAVDAHQSRHDAVKFYFDDNSTLYFERKDGLWFLVDLELKNLAAQ